jgi:hypothetical protein
MFCTHIKEFENSTAQHSTAFMIPAEVLKKCMIIFAFFANFECKDQAKTDLFANIYHSLFVYF